MMLRASIESEGGEGDVRAIIDSEAARTSGIPGAAALVAFVDATLGAEDDELAAARSRVRAELGSAALVDAAAVIGNFERMVRIADGTGIPLDAPVNVGSEGLRAQLGIDRFAAAARNAPVGALQRLIGRIAAPILRRVLRRRGRGGRVGRGGRGS